MKMALFNPYSLIAAAEPARHSADNAPCDLVTWPQHHPLRRNC
ncbi:MAG TPA: hypothetical protein VEZ70_00745 [Allosphingosinicella sp.]|nr:hypothetical protein [Allosphingosinicella sp.]